MYLKRLVIKNFRVFDEKGIELIFNKGVNAIIGENNSGKSAVIDAIRIAYSSVTYKKELFFLKSDLHVNEDGTVADYAQFDIYVEDVPKVMMEIWDPASKSGVGGEFHIKFEKYHTPNGAERIRGLFWGFGTDKNKLSADTFEAIDLVFLGALRDAENEMKPSKNSRLAQLFRNLVPDEEKRTELVQILNNAHSELLKKEELQKAKKTINRNLENIEQELLNQQIDIGLAEPRFDAIASSLRTWVVPKWIFIRKDDNVYLDADKFYKENEASKKVQLHDNGIYFETSIVYDDVRLGDKLLKRIYEIANNSFELYQNGLGFNNLLFTSTVLGDMEIKDRGIYQNLLLIEEPEAHLHPQLQKLVYEFLKKAHKRDERIQVIYTSHSPTLASKIEIENINLIYERNHRKHCLPFSETNLNDDDKLYLQKYLDVTKSQMFFARGILFVEGISEAILLPAIARFLDRPLEKYAVEIVNVDSIAFTPFVHLLSSEKVKTCFSKVSIITDDDRCSNKAESEYYINKDYDYDYDKMNIICKKLENGMPSTRYKNLETKCNENGIGIFKAKKTLEYELCCSSKNNIYHMIEAIKREYKDLGSKLEGKVLGLSSLEEQAACIWLFIRSRNKCKGAIAQYISRIIDEQYKAREKNQEIEREFTIPDYLKNAVYSVTEY